MAPGYELDVEGVRIRTSEALYQACRYPHMPDVQRLIIAQASPMSAKMKGKPFRSQSRPDWDEVRLGVMRWCLRVKLAQNWSGFAALLGATRDSPIVEESARDDYWGAKPSGDRLVGTNALGRLLMELREDARGAGAPIERVEPPPIRGFLLYGRSIGVVHGRVASPSHVHARAFPRVGGSGPLLRHRQRTLEEWLLPEDDDQP